MCRIGLLWLGASLGFAAGCATGDSTMTDLNWEPGLQATLDGSFEVSTPPQGRDAGGATGDAPEGMPNPEGPNDASRTEASLADGFGGAIGEAGVAETGTVDSGTADSGVVDSGVPEASSAEDSPSAPNDVCPATAQYATEAAFAALHGPTLCLSGSCPTGQCCYEQLKPVNVCVAR
jgi:hypothetical protein